MKKKSDASKLTNAQVNRQIVELLRARHPPPEWATFTELRDRTGYHYAHTARYIDFYAFNLYPSKGYPRIAYEIKVTRTDFNQELDNPDKREAAWELSTEAYFACPAGLVKPDELPEGWGLIEVTTGGLRRKKRAQQRNKTAPTIMPMGFVACVARHSGHPPQDMPALVWIHAGRELDDAQLRQAADEKLKNHLIGLRDKARREFENGPEYMRLTNIQGIIRRTLGWHYIHDPQALKERLEDLTKQPGELEHKMRKDLGNLADAIQEILATPEGASEDVQHKESALAPSEMVEHD